MALTDNLVGYWKLDEASGNRADSSGKGNTLTEVGTVINSTGGKVGNAPQFPGGTNRLSVSSDTNLTMGDVDFTICFWVYLDVLGGASMDLISNDNGSVWNYDPWYSFSDNRFRFYFNKAAGGTVDLDSGVSPTVSTWYFVCVQHDSVNDLAKISINNGAFATASVSGGTTTAAGSSLKLGCQGRIDEVGIWKRILSASEVTTLYNGGAGLTYPFTAGPVDYTARNKRAATIGIDGIYRMVLPVPDGVIDATDRWQITGKYRMTAAPPAALIFRNRTASRMRFPTLAC